MATQLTEDADVLTRSSGLVAASSDYSCILWIKTGSDPTGVDVRIPFAQRNAGYTAYVRWVNDVNGIHGSVDAGGGESVTADHTLTTSRWHALGYVRDGNDHLFYIDGGLHDTMTEAFGAVTLANQIIGNDGSSIGDFQVLGFREYASALTLAELIEEWNAATAVLAAYADTPLVSDVLDISGNARNWTNTGCTFVSGPLQIPLSTGFYTEAYTINSIPAHYIKVCKDEADTVFFAWWKYTEPTRARVIGFRSSGVIGGGGTDYTPNTAVYTGTDADAFVGDTSDNANSQLPVVVGQTLWFVAVRNTTPLSEAVCEFTIEDDYNTVSTVPVGTVMIRTASISSAQIDAGYTGLPIGFIDPATGTIVGFVPQFITGEDGDVLPSGVLCFADEYGSEYPIVDNTYTIVLYNPDFTVRATTTFDSYQGYPFIRAQNEAGVFYLGNRGTSSGGGSPRTIQSVDGDGNLGTLHTLTGLGMTALCVNADETICYLCSGGIGNSAVERWDMVGNAFLSDLAATVADHRVTDILVMADGSVIVGYFKSTVTVAFYVVRYSAAGAVLNTYTPVWADTLAAVNPRLGYSGNGTPSFLVFVHLATGFSDIREIRVSDGFEFSASLTPDSSNPTFPQLSPPTPVTSDSCPIIQLRVAFVIGEDDGGGGEVLGYDVTDNLIRRLRRAPHMNNENTRVFYNGVELDFDRGIGTRSGQGVNPQFMFRVSRDGGRTWSSEMKMRAGAKGQYRARAYLERLGYARDAVFEVVVSDPNDWRLVNAWLTPDPVKGDS